MQRMKLQKQVMLHRKMKSIERSQHLQEILRLKAQELERIAREDRERSLELWRQQVRHKIDQSRQRKYLSQEPLKSLYA